MVRKDMGDEKESLFRVGLLSSTLQQSRGGLYQQGQQVGVLAIESDSLLLIPKAT